LIKTDLVSVKTKRILIILLIFLPIFLLRLRAKLDFPFQVGDKIKIRAQIRSQPTSKGDFQYFKLRGISIRTSSHPQLNYGDWIEAIGIVTPGKNKGIINQYWLKEAEVNKLEKINLFSPIFRLRAWIERLYRKSLPEPHASLLAGIVLGIKSSLPSKFFDNLRTSGTLHIVVASGMNISLFSGSLADLLARLLKRNTAFIVSLVCILIYCVIAGMEPPIIRAALMAMTLFLGKYWGREALSLWTLFLVGIIMLAFSPLLLFDVGFQLSFMATAGLICLAPRFEKFMPKGFISIFAGSFAETLAAQIFTMPILLATFGNFNLLSMIPNILVLELIPFLMIAGLAMAVFFPIARLIGLVLWLPLQYFVIVINLFGRFDIFSIRV
jgi:competence protein ComEC